MRIPVIPTIVVLIACAIMVWLGIWQLGRADEKAELIARYEASAGKTGILPNSALGALGPEPAYRQFETSCMPEGDVQFIAGTSATGRNGYVAAQACQLLGFDWGGGFVVVLGWTEQLREVDWEGGDFVGTYVPSQKSSVAVEGEQVDYHFVASPPLAGLQPLAKPNPNDLPNNHLSYAVQWFLFALTALVIYILALRRRGRDK